MGEMIVGIWLLFVWLVKSGSYLNGFICFKD